MPLNITTTNVAGYANGLSLMIYGESGSGKTHLLGTFPDEQLLLISTEAKLLTLKDRNINVIVITSWVEALELLDFLEQPQNIAPFTVLGLDSLTKLAQLVFKEVSLLVKDGRQVYGEMAERMMYFIQRFKAIQKHKVVICHQVLLENGGMAKYYPSLPGKALLQSLPYEFDHILCTVSDTDNEGHTSYSVLTVPNYQYLAKGSPKLAQHEQPDLPTIFNKILGE